MKEESRGGNSPEKLNSGITPDQFTQSTLVFVYRHLPSWRDDPQRPAEQAEDKLNLQLCKFLDIQARNSFPMVHFNHEEYQQGRRSVDLSASPTQTTIIDARVYSIYDPILVFECKRLPAPTKAREREYVTGGKKRSGGIQRFKLDLHGHKLDLVAMIGYVQGNTPKHWHTTINRWISELSKGQSTDGCVWDKSEKLGGFREDVAHGTASCQSIHGRTGKGVSSKVGIRHLWVVMSEN